MIFGRAYARMTAADVDARWARIVQILLDADDAAERDERDGDGVGPEHRRPPRPAGGGLTMNTCEERRDVVGDLLWPRAVPGLGSRQTAPLAPCADCLSTGGHPVVYGHVVERDFVVVVRHDGVPSQTWAQFGGVALCRAHAVRRIVENLAHGEDTRESSRSLRLDSFMSRPKR